ncbi:copper chaperone PCu(A)C [Massilia sp. B-10]|nr:copper chaperone PCu(A)C [Massilia sp. B-10]
MRVESSTQARLVGVSSPVAAQVELHQMDMKGGMMKMQQVDGIDLPPGKGVNLASGSYHIMLVGLKQQLKAGDTIMLTLQVEHPGKKRKRSPSRCPSSPSISRSLEGACLSHALNYFRHPARWQLWIRIACFVVLLNALAPSVSHLVSAVRADGDLFLSSMCVTEPAGKGNVINKFA